jgi:transposase InsO family protein
LGEPGYTTEFKVKIALEAIKGQRTVNEIATHYRVHPNQVMQWKKQAIESLPDVFSTKRERKYVLSWEVSTTMESDFCLSALNRSLQGAKPEIFNIDQGSQFTSCAFTGILKEREIAISMDGRGRALDNIFVERLWRSVKYEEVYLHDYETVPETITGLRRYFEFYNHERLHQSLDYKTPEAVYRLSA